MEDFLGNKMVVADKVIYCKFNGNLYRGKVEGFTDTRVKIAYDDCGMRKATTFPDKLVVVNW